MKCSYSRVQHYTLCTYVTSKQLASCVRACGMYLCTSISRSSRVIFKFQTHFDSWEGDHQKLIYNSFQWKWSWCWVWWARWEDTWNLVFWRITSLIWKIIYQKWPRSFILKLHGVSLSSSKAFYLHIAGSSYLPVWMHSLEFVNNIYHI